RTVDPRRPAPALRALRSGQLWRRRDPDALPAVPPGHRDRPVAGHAAVFLARLFRDGLGEVPVPGVLDRRGRRRGRLDRPADPAGAPGPRVGGAGCMKGIPLKGWPVKLLVTVALLAALFAFLDIGQLREHAADLRWNQVGMAALVVLLAIVLSAWKWGLLLASRGFPLPMTRLLRHYFVGLFFNNLLPSTVGGDAVRAWATA